jgi:integrase/recombinase XerD
LSKLTPAMALELFIEDLARRNYSPATMKEYRHYTEKFFGYLTGKDSSDLKSVTLEMILDYTKYLEHYRRRGGKRYSQASKDNALKAVRQFFHFLKRKDLILLDPTEGMPPIHARDQFPRSILTRSEVELLLAQPNTKTLTGFRDRTIMETLYSTGIRRQEVCRLTIYDIDFSAGLLRVNEGKGRKDRVVPIGKVAVRYVKEYLENVRPKLLKGRSGKALFLNQKGLPFEPNSLGNIIWRHVRRAGFKKQVSCHSFRHTCATEMLRGGSSVRYVQEMLGHAHIKTTQVYTRVVPMDLKKVHRTSHPRERKRNKDVPAFPAGDGSRDGKIPFYRGRKGKKRKKARS